MLFEKVFSFFWGALQFVQQTSAGPEGFVNVLVRVVTRASRICYYVCFGPRTAKICVCGPGKTAQKFQNNVQLSESHDFLTRTSEGHVVFFIVFVFRQSMNSGRRPCPSMLCVMVSTATRTASRQHSLKHLFT